MTNEEAISVLYDSLGGRQDNFQEAFDIAINSIEENTKLKAEIEQLKSTISEMETTTAQEDDLK